MNVRVWFRPTRAGGGGGGGGGAGHFNIRSITKWFYIHVEGVRYKLCMDIYSTARSYSCKLPIIIIAVHGHIN